MQHWDHSTREQRQHRKHRITGRGETDPKTGKTHNPNNITGVKFIGTVEELAMSGFLEVKHMDAAEDYTRLCRANRGSPSSEDCITAMMRGHVDGGGDDEHGPSAQDQRDWREIKRALGLHQRAELDRTLWESDHGYTTRPDLLRQGLEIVAAHFKR